MEGREGEVDREGGRGREGGRERYIHPSDLLTTHTAKVSTEDKNNATKREREKNKKIIKKKLVCRCVCSTSN